MSVNGERKMKAIRPDFNRSIRLDFQGARVSSDTGFLLLREIDERLGFLRVLEKPLKISVPLPTPGTLWFRWFDNEFIKSLLGMRTVTMRTFFGSILRCVFHWTRKLNLEQASLCFVGLKMSYLEMRKD